MKEGGLCSIPLSAPQPLFLQPQPQPLSPHHPRLPVFQRQEASWFLKKTALSRYTETMATKAKKNPTSNFPATKSNYEDLATETLMVLVDDPSFVMSDDDYEREASDDMIDSSIILAGSRHGWVLSQDDLSRVRYLVRDDMSRILEQE